MEKTKPDLMMATGARRPAGSKRILAQLEHGRRTPPHPARAAGWTIDGWTIGLFALLLLMCSIAWMMHAQTITPKTFRRDYNSSSSPGVARRTAEGKPAQEQPAIIVNEAVPRSGADGDAASAAQARSAMDASSTGGALDVAARSARTVAVTPRPSTPLAHAAATATTAPARPVATTGPATGAAGDTDVTLLTALMAHTSKPAAVAPERPRDVVERQEGDSTAQLLARCKQLGLIEGMLCRSRICSGRWESDAACRAPSH